MTPEEHLMKSVVEAWGRADMQPLKDALDDQIVWKSAATRWDDRIRSGGVHNGRAEVIALFSKVQTAYFNHGAKLKEISSNGETVWGLFEVTGAYAPVAEGRQRASRTMTGEIALRWRIRNGKIIEAQTFFDTAGLIAEQERGASDA